MLSGKLVDHWIPDRPRKLQEVCIVGPEADEPFKVDRAGVILVVDPRLAVIYDQSTITQWAVGGCYRCGGNEA